MARRPYVNLAGDLSGWPKGFVPTPSFLRNFDQYASELVNGGEGGTWAPEDPIVLGPFGSPTVTLSTAGSVLSGDVETLDGNGRDERLDIPGLVLQSASSPAFNTARTRSVVVPFTNFIEADSGIATNLPRYDVDPLTLGARAIVTASNSRMVSVPCPLRAQHRGATIDSVDFRVIVSGRQTALPGTMMRFRVLAVSGDTAASLHTATGTYDANGWYIDQAGTVGAFTNNGQVRVLTFTPNQNNTSLNPDSTFLMLQARLVTLGAIVISATVHLSAIADFRQE